MQLFIPDINVPEGDIQCECVYTLLIYNKKYYLQIYLDNCKQTNDRLFRWKSFWRFDIILLLLILLLLLYYDRIDIGEGLDLAKSNNSKECMISPYWCFNDGFNI